MNHRILTFFAALLFAAALAAPSRAQVAPPAQPAQPSQAPAPSTAPAATPAPTQPAAQNSTGSSPSSAQPANPPAKHVWTDDDMGDLRSSSSISTVGNSHSNASKPGAKSANSNAPRSKTAQYYHDQIVRLQGQVPPLDEKISDLQAAIEGKPVTGSRTFGGVRPDDWKDELQRLQKQRDDIVAKIATLQDQARHNGVPENQIP
jgi:hypothetical protein